MAVVEPAYKVPSKHTVERRIEKRGEDIKERIKAALKEAESVAISSDGWTSISNEAYQTVTGHFVNPNRELECVTLSTCAMEESHTGESIAERIYHIASEYDIESKTYGLVRDNASNIDCAARFLQEGYNIEGDTSCAVRSLKLCINIGLALSKGLLQSASKLVGHFKHSPKALRALEKAQEALKIPTQALVQMVKIRWNSAFYMLHRRPIEKVLTDRALTSLDMQRKLKLSDGDWTLIEELNPILPTLEMANTVLCAENKNHSINGPSIDGQACSKPPSSPGKRHGSYPELQKCCVFRNRKTFSAQVRR